MLPSVCVCLCCEKNRTIEKVFSLLAACRDFHHHKPAFKLTATNGWVALIWQVVNDENEGNLPLIPKTHACSILFFFVFQKQDVEKSETFKELVIVHL